MTERARDGSRVGARAANGRRRLTDEQYAEIRRLYGTGASQPELAARFGVDTSRISQIVRGLAAGSRGHIHSWQTEGADTWCVLCGVERVS